MTAVDWREFVSRPKTWTEEKWKEAAAQGLAQKFGAAPGFDKWTLTDAGLDLYLDGGPLVPE